ncbi:MAG: hypothetical protein ABGX20_17275 [Bacillus sp. (in: firmicutes)]
MENRQLSIPIYLNHKIVFDLMAILEQGFSKIRQIDISNTHTNIQESNENLSFLGLVTNNESTSEKVYTPSSLFSKLRDELIERKFLKFIDESFEIEELRSGDFVEFSALLRKNPLIETFEGFIELMEVGLLFESFSKPDNQKSKGKSPTATQLVEMKKFMSKINTSNTLDLLGTISHNEEAIQAVVPVENVFFNNKTPADLIDGRFTVVGKTIKSIHNSSEESINLLRGTSLGLLPTEHRNQFVYQLSQLTTMGLEFPKIFTEVKGPAIQIVPVAIFI